MISQRGAKSLLTKRSSMRSFKSLSPSSSTSSMDRKSCGGLSRTLRSSSSLCLQDISSDRSFLTTSSGQDSVSARFLASQCENVPIEDRVSRAGLEMEGTRLVQCIVLIAVAVQIPNFIDDIIEILDLHYHSFPLLVVLGVVPSLFWKRGPKDAQGFTPSSSNNIKPWNELQTNSYRTSASTLDEIRRAVSQDSLITDARTTNAMESVSGVDEWGHFAELDEQMLKEQDVTFMMNSSAGSLGTLPEEEDESNYF